MYAMPVCGLIAMPGLFFHYWMITVGYLCAIVAVLAALSYALIFLFFLLTKTTTENSRDNSVYFSEIGRLVISSDHLFFNDSLTIKDAEKVNLQTNEYSIFILVSSNEQFGLLLFSTTNNHNAIKNILINDDNDCRKSTVLVDSGKLYIIAESLVFTKSLDFFETKYIDNEIAEFYDAGCNYFYLSVEPIYGDGEYEIRRYDFINDSLIAVEIVPDSLGAVTAMDDKNWIVE
jgi:hypothetical protein